MGALFDNAFVMLDVLDYWGGMSFACRRGSKERNDMLAPIVMISYLTCKEPGLAVNQLR